jgi:hypothetical protein
MSPLRRVLAGVAAIAALLLIGLEAGPLADLFLRADPTLQGSFSLLNARSLLSVAGHLALTVLSLRLAFVTAPATPIPRTGAWLCYGALGLELLSLVPCVFAGDALCGVFYVVIGPLTALAMLAGFGLFLGAGASRMLKRGALAGMAALGLAAFAAYWYVTPKSPEDCARISDDLKRGSCVMNFALQTGDDRLCEQVTFDSSRWTCIYQIAERKGDASLCRRIVPPCRYTGPGLACEPERYRDTCYLVTARELRDPGLCERMAPGDLQASCRRQTAGR